MGQDLSMIVHVCGIEIDNPIESIAQTDLINSIFKVSNSKESTYNYTVRNSEKPKWNAIIYRQQKIFH